MIIGVCLMCSGFFLMKHYAQVLEDKCPSPKKVQCSLGFKRYKELLPS